MSRTGTLITAVAAAAAVVVPVAQADVGKPTALTPHPSASCSLVGAKVHPDPWAWRGVIGYGHTRPNPWKSGSLRPKPWGSRDALGY
jgi:hypothetical protein